MITKEVLKLDYDITNFNLIFNNYFLNRSIFIFNTFKLKFCYVNVFRTKQGHHIYIGIANKLSNRDIIFLQLLLGSDFRRECWYWKQIKYTKLKNKIWNVLFSFKEYDRKSQRKGKKPSQEIYSLTKSKKLANYLIKIYDNPKWR